METSDVFQTPVSHKLQIEAIHLKEIEENFKSMLFDIEELNTENKKLQHNEASLTSKIEKMEKSFQLQLKDLGKSHAKEIKEAKTKITNLQIGNSDLIEKEIPTLKSKIEKTLFELEKIEQKMKASEFKKSELESQISEIKNEIKDKNNENSNLNKKFMIIVKENAQLLEINNKWEEKSEKENQEMLEMHSSTISQFENLKHSFKKEKEQLINKINSQRCVNINDFQNPENVKNFDKSAEKISTLEIENKNLKEETKSLSQKLSKMKEEYNSAIIVSKDYLTLIQGMKQLLNQLNNESEDAKGFRFLGVLDDLRNSLVKFD